MWMRRSWSIVGSGASTSQSDQVCWCISVTKSVIRSQRMRRQSVSWSLGTGSENTFALSATLVRFTENNIISLGIHIIFLLNKNAQDKLIIELLVSLYERLRRYDDARFHVGSGRRPWDNLMQLWSALWAGTSSPSLARCLKMAERRQQMVVDRGGRPVRVAISSFRTNWCHDIPRMRRWHSIWNASSDLLSASGTVKMSTTNWNVKLCTWVIKTMTIVTTWMESS